MNTKKRIELMLGLLILTMFCCFVGTVFYPYPGTSRGTGYEWLLFSVICAFLAFIVFGVAKVLHKISEKHEEEMPLMPAYKTPQDKYDVDDLFLLYRDKKPFYLRIEAFVSSHVGRYQVRIRGDKTTEWHYVTEEYLDTLKHIPNGENHE